MKSILFVAFIALTAAFCNTPEPATTTPTDINTTTDTSTSGSVTDTTARRSDTLRLQ